MNFVNLNKFLSLIFFVLISILSLKAQYVDSQKQYEKKIKKQLNLKTIVWDEINKDGVFIGQSSITGKWGMFRFNYDGNKPYCLIKIKYDSLGMFKLNGSFAIVKNNGKYGVVSGAWHGDMKEKETLPCNYELLRYVEHNGVEMVASYQDGHWGYLNYKNGDTLIPFVHREITDLPAPSRTFYKNPIKQYPEALQPVFNQPDTLKELDLSFLDLSFIPNEIGNCKNLRTLNLEGNNYTTFPDSFFELSKLENLYLGGNSKLLDFDERFIRLTNLKTLVIGGITQSGRETYSMSNLRFSKKLSELKSIRELRIVGYLKNDSIPSFVYELPNLNYLSVELRNLRNIRYDLSKLSCKDSLVDFNLANIDNLDNWNANIHKFPNLEEFSMNVTEMNDGFESIMKIPRLREIYITSHSRIGDGNYYQVNTVMDYTLNMDVMTTEQRKEAIAKWDAYFNKEH
ncbi:MAG: WG repeat-containing protein [Bacteroidetes bacterium]|nr:WG repeat-containing protein [Bacteroidota bacterium]